ncbi:ferrous iron transporter B [Bacillus lacus]|uniref:Ferrous iron transporter B n=1 Tax=Metabacillus lacus TaxID=1983721 RepID=A0A7X2J0L4_9BACI|nr:nucleoside recognition domain-containing protein [Metabacillus lacus]MRX73248.1 ferrous iron transporter B [Metabacillus lacus]
MLTNPSSPGRILLLGFESSGKSTLFSRLAGRPVSHQTNVKGSTYSVNEYRKDHFIFIDAPGLQEDPSLASKITSNELSKADSLILVIRGTSFTEELERLSPLLDSANKKGALIVTHADKMRTEDIKAIKRASSSGNLPVYLVDSRQASSSLLNRIEQSLFTAPSLNSSMLQSLLKLNISRVEPAALFFEKKISGPMFALCFLILMYLLPVAAAFQLSSFIEEPAERYILDPLSRVMSGSPFIFTEMMLGDYGLLSLGLYSFIWAFPVVLLISVSSSITEDMGIKDRIADTLDPVLRKAGLQGRDLIPILSGFGCNVVAVFQSRGCSFCTRKQCVSLISFGSACSYQIGATLSVFNAAQKPWMFFPYLLLLLFGSIIHSRLWYRNAHQQLPPFLHRKSFIQFPTFRGICYKLVMEIKQFLQQAMPVFLMICLAAGFLNYLGILESLSYFVAPLLGLLGLPAEGAAGIIFSAIRKDGILLFNEGSGSLLASMTGIQILLLVFLASTLSACSVTLWTIAKELGWRTAVMMILRQLATSLLCTVLIYGVWSLFG